MREFDESEALTVQQVDKGCKTSWKWPWLKGETAIEVKGVKRNFKLSDLKTFFFEKKGCAKCTLCVKELNYGSRGLHALLAHCQSTIHTQRVASIVYPKCGRKSLSFLTIGLFASLSSIPFTLMTSLWRRHDGVSKPKTAVSHSHLSALSSPYRHLFIWLCYLSLCLFLCVVLHRATHPHSCTLTPLTVLTSTPHLLMVFIWSNLVFCWNVCHGVVSL